MIIYNHAGASFWEPLRPREDEACFVCAQPLVTDSIVAQEGVTGLINGVGQHAKRPHVLYLHAKCAARLAEALKLDALTITYQRQNE